MIIIAWTYVMMTPITIHTLNRISINSIPQELGQRSILLYYAATHPFNFFSASTAKVTRAD